MNELIYKLRYLHQPLKMFRKIKIKIKIYVLKMFILFPSDLKIISAKNTIEEVKSLIRNKIKGAYLRFGDGDVNLSEGIDELLQKSSIKIQAEMVECFSLSGEGIIKCLPIHSNKYGFELGMKAGLYKSEDKWADNMLYRTYKYFIGNRIYSPVALSYLIAFNQEYAIDFLRFLKSFSPIFVGNENVESDTLIKLFGNSNHIKTYGKSAFDSIDDAEDELTKFLETRNNQYTLIVFAMGCSGRILEKRIYNKFNNVFLFDFGSALDFFCGWNTRSWMELMDLPDDYYKTFLDKI